MGFVEEQFPTDISYGSSGGPEYSTDIVTAQSGHEQRNSNWAEARARYNVAHGVKTKQQLNALIAFFRARKGRAYGFRFKDWADYEVVNQLIGMGNASETQFQLVKHYTSGSEVSVRIIRKPVAGTVVVYSDGIAQAGGYQLDATTGVVTFDSAPAAGVAVTADFEFDVPVRFDVDQLSATMEAYGVHSWQDIPLIEVRG
jgi:uncharacterized protein (TIGR02217 family)